MRLIDADELRANIERDRSLSDMPKMWHNGIAYAVNHIIHAPTVEIPRWIPVSEPPKYPGRFMCYYEYEEYGEKLECVDWGRYDPDAGWYVSGVLYWQPIPEPPYREESECV